MSDIIYHYCSVDTFALIVTNGTIRLSDITQSNDWSEIKWSVPIVKMAFKSLIEKVFKSKKYNSIKKSIFEIVDNYINLYFESNYKMVLACCFSEAKDLLSQWRGYADDGKGFSIGFSMMHLKDMLATNQNENYELLIGKIEYDEEVQKKDICNIVKLLEEYLLSFKNIDNFLENKKNYTELNDKIRDIFNKIFRKSILFKNPFFEEEKEWRIALIFNNDDFAEIKIEESNISFYKRDGSLIPYIDMKFCNKNCVVELIAGPKNKTCKITEFLAYNKYINVDLLKSKGSYR